MDARAVRWPVLRVVYWLSRWAVRRVGPRGGRLGSRGLALALPPGEMFHFRARNLGDRVRTRARRLFERRARPGDDPLRLRSGCPIPMSLRSSSRPTVELIVRGDEEAVDRLTRGTGPASSPLSRVAHNAVVPAGAARWRRHVGNESAGTQLTDWLHGLYRVVLALGAVHLLHGLAVVVVLYVACWRRLRPVRARRPVAAGRNGGRASADLEKECRPGRGDPGGDREPHPGSRFHAAGGGYRPRADPFELAAAGWGRSTTSRRVGGMTRRSGQEPARCPAETSADVGCSTVERADQGHGCDGPAAKPGLSHDGSTDLELVTAAGRATARLRQAWSIGTSVRARRCPSACSARRPTPRT